MTTIQAAAGPSTGTDSMHVIHLCAAGLDVHKMQITASVRLAQPRGDPLAATREFRALPPRLAGAHRLAALPRGERRRHGRNGDFLESALRGAGGCGDRAAAAPCALREANQGQEERCGGQPVAGPHPGEPERPHAPEEGPPRAGLGGALGRPRRVEAARPAGGARPGNNQSAGKRRAGRVRHGNATLRATLAERAHGAVRTHGTQFKNWHEAHVGRLRYKKSILAVAHKMLRTILAMLRDNEPCKDPGID